MEKKGKMTDSVWLKKGGTLSDKSARKEFGLSQEEIIDAIKSGKLQFRKKLYARESISQTCPRRSRGTCGGKIWGQLL
jgi:hypothetical protein